MVQDAPGFIPLVYIARCAPVIESVYYAVYEFLLLSGLAEHCPALVIESRDDLLETVDGIMSYVYLEALRDNGEGHIRYDGRKGDLTSKSPQGSTADMAKDR